MIKFNNLSASSVFSFSSGVILALCVILLLAISMLIIWGIARSSMATGAAAITFKRMSVKSAFVLVLALGFVLRIIFALITYSAKPEMALIMSAVNNFVSSGLNNYYAGGGTFLPITYYIFGIFGGFGSLFMETSNEFMTFMVKLPIVLADCGIAIVIYFIAKKFINEKSAFFISALYLLNPLFIFGSSVWGEVNIFASLLLAISMYFLVQKKFIPTIVLYSLALLTHKLALFLFPVFAVYFIYHFIVSIMVMRKSVGKARIAARNKVIALPIMVVASAVAMYLIALPMIIKDFNGNVWSYFIQMFLSSIDNIDSFGTNALSLFNLFAKNGVELGSAFPSLIFALIFGVLVAAIVLVVYLSKKNRANLVMLSSFVIMIMSLFFVGFNANTLLVCLVLLLVSYVLIRDKRLLKILVAASTLILVNSFVAMFSLPLGGGVGAGEVLTGGGMVLNMIASALMACLFVYFVLVVLDISMSLNRKQFAVTDNFKGFIADFIK